MKKKLFTLKELYEYVHTGRSFQYSAKDESEELKVLVDSKILFKQSDDTDDTEGLLPVELYSCHLGENLNGSFIPEKSGKKALPSFANRPILGYIHEVNGQPEFYGHNMEEGEDGEIIYHEIPVGVIPESNDGHFEEKDGKTYIYVRGYIYAEYSKAAEILEREGECSCSVELSIREFSYNAKDKVVVFDDFYFSGVTILGKDDNGKEVKPGMAGSNIKIAQFESSETTLIDVLEKLNETLSRFNNDQTGKEEPTVTLFEELLEQYGKTVEDVTFEYEGLSDDELRAAFKEAFGVKEVEEKSTEEEATTTTEGETNTEEPKAEENAEGATAEEFEGDTKVIENESKENSDESKDNEGETKVQESAEPMPKSVETVVEFTAKIGDQIKTFSVSINDKLEAIYNLINMAYGEIDDDFYDCVVYEDTKTIEMHGYFRNKHYRQTYKVRNNEYSLVGDRVEIFCKWMTEDELNQFENMKANYAVLEQYKADKELKEARDEKMEILNERYSAIADTKEYKALVENIDTYSNDEVEEKANAIVGKYALQGHFSQQTPISDKHFFGFTNKDDNEKKAPAYASFLN